MKNTIGKHYSGAQGDAYSAWQVNATKGLGRLVARKFQRFIPRSASVLDFGCGSGENLANISCDDRFGVEPNPASLKAATARGIIGFATLAEVPDAHVDIVISHHALEHCLTPFDELREMRRVTKQNGLLVLVLPIDDWRTQRQFDPRDINHHLYTWTPLLIGNLLQEAGFDLIEARVLNYQWPPRVRFLSTILPSPIFNALCSVWSIATKMHEMRVVARPA